MLEFINSIGWENVLTALFFVLTAIFGPRMVQFKKKLKQALVLGDRISKAAEDNKITKKEWQEIKEAWDEFSWWNGKHNPK
jgi:hypothetical protein